MILELHVENVCKYGILVGDWLLKEVVCRQSGVIVRNQLSRA